MTQRIDIRDFGARENELCTQALQKAVDVANEFGKTVCIPAGIYQTGTVDLKGVTLYLEKGACLKASDRIEDYHYIDYTHIEMGKVLPLFYSMESTGLMIRGEGTLDLNGDAFFDFNSPEIPESKIPFTQEQIEECTITYTKRPNQPLFFYRCQDVSIQDLHIVNAPSWTLSFTECNNVHVMNVTVRNSLRIPNCDGMHFCCCRDVMVRGCNIIAGDDCIAVTCATNWEVPCERVTISDCILQSCSKAISIGYMHSIVRDVVISNCIIMESNRAIVLMASKGTGLVENICINNMRLDTTIRAGNWWGNGEPLCIMGNWHDNPNYFLPPPATRFPVAVHNVAVSNIICSSENVIAVIGEENSVQDVQINSVFFTRKDSKNIKLKGNMVDLAPGKQTAVLPDEEMTYWLFVKQAKRVRIRGVTLQPFHGQRLRAICEASSQIEIEGEER